MVRIFVIVSWRSGRQTLVNYSPIIYEIFTRVREAKAPWKGKRLYYPYRTKPPSQGKPPGWVFSFWRAVFVMGGPALAAEAVASRHRARLARGGRYESGEQPTTLPSPSFPRQLGGLPSSGDQPSEWPKGCRCM
jgi:hypothetical protein